MRRPRFHTAIFEEAYTAEEIVKGDPNEAEAFEQGRSQLDKHIKDATKELGWADERLRAFTQLVLQYRRQPTIENYVQVRRLFPEIDLQVPQFGGLDALFVLESKLKKQGLDTNLIAAALDADEPSIDALCLHLLELIIARNKLPKTGPGHITMRRSTIEDATVNYLISIMLEAFDWHEETFRVPASLVVLIRHHLSGLEPSLHEEYLSRKKRSEVAFIAAQRLKPGEKLSINKLAAISRIPRSTAARWLADSDFQRWVERGRKWAAEGLFKRPR